MLMKSTRDVMLQNRQDHELGIFDEQVISLCIREVPGKGVLALKNFLPGEPILVGKPARFLTERTSYSLQVGLDEHILLVGLGPYINHSCAPNTGILTNAYGGYTFIALQHIKPGEEVTCDYETFEAEGLVGFRDQACLCGSPQCRGFLVGFFHRAEYLRQKYGLFIAEYLKACHPRLRCHAQPGIAPGSSVGRFPHSHKPGWQSRSPHQSSRP